MAGAAPHGGRLVSRVREGAGAGLERFPVTAETEADMENIADGVFSPLEGFLGEGDFEAVASGGRLAGGAAWTIPIVLDADEGTARRMRDAGDVLLAGPGGGEAVMRVEESYRPDLAAAARGVYGTGDPGHPGVARMRSMGGTLLGGRIELASRPAAGGARRHRMTPAQTRAAFAEAGWGRVVAFQTRNPPHVAHEMLQKAALATADGVFVNPLVGRKKPGDFADDVITRCYEEMIRHYYPPGRCVMATLHTEMRYAGPREAVHHAIMRQNYGCTHIIIGRDHAGVGSYYDPFAAHRIFADYPELGISPAFFPAFFYCRRCLAYTHPRACPHGDSDREQISGTALRKLIQAGSAPGEFIMRPEVSRVVLAHPRPFVD